MVIAGMGALSPVVRPAANRGHWLPPPFHQSAPPSISEFLTVPLDAEAEKHAVVLAVLLTPEHVETCNAVLTNRVGAFSRNSTRSVSGGECPCSSFCS